MTSEARRIGFILFDRADLLDVIGPANVFRHTTWHLSRTGMPGGYVLDYLSPEGGPVTTVEGLTVETEPFRPLASGEYDTLLVAGGLFDATGCDPRVIDWIARNHHCARRVGSICTGSYYLALAGLLDGRAATTHWMECEAMQAGFPAVRVNHDAIFVEDREIWTSAGISSGIDMALAMVEADHGHGLAISVARILVVFLKRPGGQAQFSSLLQCQAVEGALAPLLKWVVENPAADLRTEALAERANMSLRNFYRAFEEATGASPAKWVERFRLETAKRLLEQTDQPIEAVARQAGFGSTEQMRRAFARSFGVTPGAYRARFGQRARFPREQIDPSPLHDAYGTDGDSPATLQAEIVDEHHR